MSIVLFFWSLVLTAQVDPMVGWETVQPIIQKHCVECHSPGGRQKTLNLEPGQFFDSTIDKNSEGDFQQRIIDTQDPTESYLLKKITGDPTIMGRRMPFKRNPLNQNEIIVIKSWLESLKGITPQTLAKLKQISQSWIGRQAFNGPQLINLRTTRFIHSGHMVFKVTHRFIPSLDSGYDGFWGLNGPANVMVGFSFGISDRLNLTIQHSNIFHEWEFIGGLLLLDGEAKKSFPLGIAIHAGGSWASQEIAGRDRSDSRHFKFNLQLSISYLLNETFSILVSPAYSSQTDHWNDEPEDTFVLAAGLRIKINKRISLLGEWMPVLSGYKSLANGWALGAEYKIGKHLFQLFLLNTSGLTTDQFLPGGDLLLSEGDMRVGFTIYREF